MGAEVVELDGHHGRVVEREDMLEAAGERRPVDRVDALVEHELLSEDAAVEMPAAGERRDRRRERVVHVGVELVALEVLRLLVPDLGHDVGLRVDRLHPAPELPPEVLVGDLQRDIEAPAVGTHADPVLGDAEDVLADLAGSSMLSLGRAGRSHHAR